MKELFVPVAIIAVLASLLLPIPPVLLDFLIVGNIGLSLLLLISSLYINDTLKLSALPTLLLLATIYRLSLNVASTRLILGSGEAGHVIEAFGAVVISGNLVVGTVIFLVITLIQFMVIAKGSERVAEVAARFTLDALPGKQMSIDADVRAGLIDFETARKRRQELQTESRFYGALDGAMKFVKGDAIAGIIIAVINIIGGLAIGICVQDLELSSAISKYTLLTIGDGLVSQIPALLSALAAGIVVTRVARGDGATVSQEFLSQLGQFKSAKFIIAGFCLIIMFVPGMPFIPFASLALALVLSALFKTEKPQKNSSEEEHFEPRKIPVLEILVNKEQAQAFFSLPGIRKEINKSRKKIYELTGMLLLAPEFSFLTRSDKYFEIKIRGISIVTGILPESTEEAVRYVLQNLIQVVLNHQIELIDDILTRRLLDFLDKDHPELVSSIVPGAITITQLTEILKALSKEGVSIRQLDLILQGIAESNCKGEGTRLLLEDVRVTLGRIILSKYLGSEKKLDCYVTDAALDMAMCRAEKGEQALPTNLLSILAAELDQSTCTNAVIIISKGARALLRDCLRLRRIKIPVLAHEEIPEDLDMNIISIVGRGKIEDTEEFLSKLAA